MQGDRSRQAEMGHGKVGGALEFDGTTYVDRRHAPAFEGDAPFSIGIWAYPTANDLLALASKMDDGAGPSRLRHAPRRRARSRPTSSTAGRTTASRCSPRRPLSLNAWHHVSGDLRRLEEGRRREDLRRRQARAARRRCNDTLQDTIQTDKPLHIGRRGASLPFKGKLDDVQLFGAGADGRERGPARRRRSRSTWRQPCSRSRPRSARRPSRHRSAALLPGPDRHRSTARLKAELGDVLASRRRSSRRPSRPSMVMEEMPQRRATRSCSSAASTISRARRCPAACPPSSRLAARSRSRRIGWTWRAGSSTRHIR